MTLPQISQIPQRPRRLQLTMKSLKFSLLLSLMYLKQQKENPIMAMQQNVSTITHILYGATEQSGLLMPYPTEMITINAANIISFICSYFNLFTCWFYLATQSGGYRSSSIIRRRTCSSGERIRGRSPFAFLTSPLFNLPNSFRF